MWGIAEARCRAGTLSTHAQETHIVPPSRKLAATAVIAGAAAASARLEFGWAVYTKRPIPPRLG